MLHQSHGGVRRQRKTGHAHAIYLVLGDTGLLHQRAQSLAQPPMGAVGGVAHVGYGYRHGGNYTFVPHAPARHAGISWRLFRERVSMHSGVSGRPCASVFSEPRWILLVAVRGKASTKAT